MNDLLADADLCVKCGLCLPHCPTYTKTQNENESPRGRIALIQAVAGQHLPATKQLLAHIDNCLLCRACENACPAAVPYGRLVDNFRGKLYAQRPPSFALSVLKQVSHNKTIKRLAISSLGFYQNSRLQKTVRGLKLPQLLRLQTIDRLVPDISFANEQSFKPYYAATGPTHGTVGLFIGCMGELLDRETIAAAIKVLTAVGYNVAIPETQHCCGALALHDGDQKTADQLAAFNVHAFAEANLDAVVTIASGCGAHLQEYQNRVLADKIMDISQFLSRSKATLSAQLKPLTASVCVHTPCSLKNVMHQENGALALMQLLPGITLRPLPENVLCCGSAGGFMLEHPQMANALLADVLAVVLASPADYLVSSNIGCALHIAAGLKERGIRLEVVHPVALIARQLDG
ncbi:MAG: (Fe-S)-binding protein [Methylococcales bacterium]|nr:(Fe-S)-binding protein [Methylococcales bacterium]